MVMYVLFFLAAAQSLLPFAANAFGVLLFVPCRVSNCGEFRDDNYIVRVSARKLDLKYLFIYVNTIGGRY
jgi:hypothetical protein